MRWLFSSITVCMAGEAPNMTIMNMRPMSTAGSTSVMTRASSAASTNSPVLGS